MVEQISVDHQIEQSYEKGLGALGLLREWWQVLQAHLPDGTMVGLEKNLIALRALMAREPDGGKDEPRGDALVVAEEVLRAMRRIQGAGLLFFRNQPGVANRFAALSFEGE